MSDLRLSGLASGLDTTALIEKLMQVERRPIIMSQSRITKNNLVLESLRGLSTKFIALEEAAKKVQNLASFSPSASTDNTSTPFKEKVVDIGSSSVLGAGLLQTLNAKTFGTEAGAVGGEYTVKVNSRAQTNTITTGPVPLQTDGFVADRGYLKFTNLSDGTVINLGADPAVSWGDNKSLKEVADWINAQGSAPMTASVANNRLILTAKNTGAAFNYSVEVAAQAGAGVAADSYNMGFRAATSAGTSSSSEKVVDVSSAAVLGVG
ncbi:MAG: flagellar cap protein FliD N-terminal domain-containing protein, partial [Candidatus Sericytochromatia bacterium]|nr:flagellar cap protein FliD N-terminal domain-containing protein [Candidatus Sericytochromatia bacterium]